MMGTGPIDKTEWELLEFVRGQHGDFRMTLLREGGRYFVATRIHELELGAEGHGNTFSMAWDQQHVLDEVGLAFVRPLRQAHAST